MSHNVLYYSNIFTEGEINYILNLPEVVNSKVKIDNKTIGSIYFNVELTIEMKQKIFNNLGLDLSNIHSIPMRWIKGDTLPHIDTGAHSFDNTYLMYLTNSSGDIIVDGN